MHSMTVALAAYTTPLPDPAADTGQDSPVATAFMTVWDWAEARVPGGSITILAVLWCVGAGAKNLEKWKGGGKAEGKKGFFRSIGSFFVGLWEVLVTVAKVVAGIFRFYTGRELRGEPRSDAGFFRAGTYTVQTRPAGLVADLGSIAMAPPRISLVKPRRGPSARARRFAHWIDTYQGRSARLLDRAVHGALRVVALTGKLWRAAQATGRFFRRIYRAVAPVVIAVFLVLRMWHRWPYALRGLARLGLTAGALGLLVPAWRTMTLILLANAFAGLVAIAQRWKPRPAGDDAVYGPRVWAILRDDLKLPEEELRQQWLKLPEKLGAEGARIVLRLPWTFRGSQLEKDQITFLLNSRLPGEWVGRYSFRDEAFTAVYTHKPPPPPPIPEPECPDRVSFFDADIQEAIANCKKGEIVIGKDTFGRIIVKELGDGETPHWALSVGTGGGKSAFAQMVIAQLIRQGYSIIAADVKRVSVKIYNGLPGFYLYNDPKNPQDMRRAIEWFKDEIDARTSVKEDEPDTEFPGLLLLIEESNEFADISREWWDDNRKSKADEDGPAERAADPIWGSVASSARLGRFVHGNILAVFQDLRDQALGGKGLRNLFRLKFMGNFNSNQWKNVIGTTPIPESVDKAGRMMIVEGNHQYWVQTCYGEPKELRAWALEQREATGFDPAAGLFGTAPEPSPKRLPRLLARLSRDGARNGQKAPQGASAGGLTHETAGRPSHDEADVMAEGAQITDLRDRLRVIPGQGRPGAGHGAQADPTAPPVLLTLAEISRRLGPTQGVPKYDTLRAHKTRREDFPEATVKDGKELYMESQILAYYQAQTKNA
ncbi:hypothetical protein ACWGDE_24760 [Streptomyces sp. NPDC054956]